MKLGSWEVGKLKGWEVEKLKGRKVEKLGRGSLDVWKVGRALVAVVMAAPVVAAVPAQPACRVEIEADPAGAEILLDHKPLADWPGAMSVEPGKWEVRLDPGDYLVGFKAEDYDPATAPLRVRQGDARALVARTLAKTTGLALLTSDPPEAEITIDGVSFGRTPRMISDLALGTWQATFSLPSFKAQTLQFTLKDRTPVAVAAKLSSDSATLEIVANVADAEISVNGAPRGRAPCTVERIPAGEVVIEAKAHGYRDFTLKVRVGEAERLPVDVRMEPLPASLSVYSIPVGARVYIDNNYRGESSLTLDDLAPGVHRIRVEKDGFDPMARTVSLGRGDSATEEFRLRANTGKLSITSVPAGVTVFVDGVKSGETPPGEVKDLSGVLEIDSVAEGPHSLKFSKPGYYEKSAECLVRRGETTLQRIELARQFIPDYEVVTETGAHKGIFLSITPTAVRMETSPGVVSQYPILNIISHGPLKEK